MRETRTAQRSIFQIETDHEIARELKRMSDWLDKHSQLLERVGEDIQSRGGSRRGRSGLTLDAVLRCAILKQYRQVDYRTLAFYLRDSVSFIEFARVDRCRPPSKSTLQALISAIRPTTWQALDRCLLASADTSGIDRGEVIRVDATVTDSAILAPQRLGPFIRCRPGHGAIIEGGACIRPGDFPQSPTQGQTAALRHYDCAHQ